MKYFSSDLWERINSPEKSIRDAAENEWKKREDEYRKQYESVKAFFPSSFLAEFIKHNGFHDFTIVSIECLSEKREVSIHLSHGDAQCRLELKEISRIQLDFACFENCICGKPAWGYSELDRTPDGRLKISVLCDVENEMSFEFASVVCRKE